MTSNNSMEIGRKPKLAAPEGACDCHMHIYDPRFSAARTAVSPPPEAPLGDYFKIRQQLGLTRAVIVQPSAYGADNSCTMEAVKTLGKDARGVVVVNTTVTDAALLQLTDAGARGIRFHMLPGGVLPWDVLEEMAKRVGDFGWHVQLQMDGRFLSERESVLKRLPGILVIDHVGKFLEPVTTEHAGFKTLLRLVDTGRCWVKLSAPYEVSKAGPPYYDDVGALAKTLIKAAPERMLWASNWPHPSVSGPAMPDDADLLDVLLDWADDHAVRSRILVDNPATLYGF